LASGSKDHSLGNSFTKMGLVDAANFVRDRKAMILAEIKILKDLIENQNEYDND